MAQRFSAAIGASSLRAVTGVAHGDLILKKPAIFTITGFHDQSNSYPVCLLIDQSLHAIPPFIL